VSNVDDQFDPEDYEGVQERMATLPRREIRRFEKDRRELARAQQERDDAVRQLVFARAGIDLDDPAAEWFLKGYDGEMTADAVRTAAVKARLIRDGGGGTPITDAEAQGHELMSRVANGAQNVNQEDDITRGLKDIRNNIHWRDADKARDEIMRLVDANDIKYYPGAALPGA